MRISRSLIIAGLVTLAFLSANFRPDANRARTPHASYDEDRRYPGVDDAFLYDVVTRFNESLVANIDAIDAAVTAVLAGNVAIAVFAIDKIRELHRMEECWAIVLLAGSLLACVCAYVIGFPLGTSDRDGVLPSRFVLDFTDSKNAAVSSAVETVLQSGMKNVTVRAWKRALVVAAIMLLLASAVVVMFARLSGNVI